MTAKQALELMTARRLARSGEARRIRTAGGLSLSEVASTVGVSPAAVSRWESGQRRPYGRPALAYARLLNSIQEAQGE